MIIDTPALLAILRGEPDDRRFIDTIPFDNRQLDVARLAHARFGRGSGSRARLTFGDCFSYALAMTRDEPLLFKGNDFTYTDARAAL